MFAPREQVDIDSGVVDGYTCRIDALVFEVAYAESVQVLEKVAGSNSFIEDSTVSERPAPFV